uniref:Dynein axonemal intermediate chain 4 n=1 Tax=Culicoides sonorensis TaxID=179676 RepID=A0A336L7K3_CULSO
MWDTYADLEASTKEISLDGEDKTVEITTFTKDGMENPDQFLSTNKNFKKSAMVIERLLAGNIFGDRQKRFRNFKLPDPYDKDVKYLYRLDTLWVYKVPELYGKAVAGASWCTRNGDLLAVAYGVYGFTNHEHRKLGCVCVWSIKNPVNPERRYVYTAPVTAVRFSKKSPQLLAIGLYDGRVEIRDITLEEGPPIAKSDRKTSPGFEPVMQIEWVDTTDDKEVILAAMLDGTIMKYTMITGVHLLGQIQMTLDRVEGVVEGLAIAKKKTFLEADRHPQALCLKMHPSRKEAYFVGTDEGCLHRCSIYFSHQHTGVMQAHQGGIYAIEYSPWSPKIFLTCGADWKLRIWVENIFEPILELSHHQEPFQCAMWSPIHSTILATCTRNSVQLWDLRRKNMKPASEHSFDSTSTLTIIKFSNCGRSIIVGDSAGKVHVCALEDMPFPPHFQYDELEAAVNRILEANENLHKQFQELGYLGY